MKALVLTDIQNDFLPGGALVVPDGDKIVPVANRTQFCDTAVSTPSIQNPGGDNGVNRDRIPLFAPFPLLAPVEASKQLIQESATRFC